MGGKRQPEVGSRFRRMMREPLSGLPVGFQSYDVAAIEDASFLAPAGRIKLQSESGRTVYADADHFWSMGYEAIDNVVPLRRALSDEGGVG